MKGKEAEEGILGPQLFTTGLAALVPALDIICSLLRAAYQVNIYISPTAIIDSGFT